MVDLPINHCNHYTFIATWGGWLTDINEIKVDGGWVWVHSGCGKGTTMRFTDTFCHACGKPTPLAVGNCLICGAMLPEDKRVLVMPTPAKPTEPTTLAA